MRIETIDDRRDPRLANYADIRQRNPSRQSPYFIAEGLRVIRRLLNSPFAIESLLATPRRWPLLAPAVEQSGRPIAVYLVAEALASQLVGFHFHAGLMACGRRRRFAADEVLAPIAAEPSRPAIVVAAPATTLPDNLGSLIRTASVFGAHALMAGTRGADPFSRRAIRVSSGHAFRIPIVEARDFAATLAQWIDRAGFVAVGTGPGPGAMDAAQFQPPRRTILVFGNEAAGLDTGILNLCQQRVWIPMHDEDDSLNVVQSAAILLHHIRTRARWGTCG
jgi:tRNA G18 (ribose-2'-O)-methylase SpoU